MTEDEFYSKIDVWVQADIESWTHITQLAHFCKKYEEKNGVRFRLVRARKGPTMGKEAGDFAKLFRVLAPENYKSLPKGRKDKVRYEVNLKIYNYVRWMFDYKFRRGNKSVTGTRLFLIPSIINEFERMYEKYLSTRKTQDSIDILIEWCREEISEIFDSHQFSRKEDILLIKRYVEMYSLPNNSPEVQLLNKAREMGLL